MDAVTRDRIYDHCLSVLRDTERAEAALAAAEAEIAAREPELEDPAHRDVWVLAIARHAALDAASGLDPEPPPADADEPLDADDRPALQAAVWDALGQLAPLERAMLDLHLRQGLTGEDLARALGLEAAQSYERVSALRQEQEDALRAMLAARTGVEAASLPNPLALYAAMPRHEAPEALEPTAPVAVVTTVTPAVAAWEGNWPPAAEQRTADNGALMPIAAGAAVAVVVAVLIAMLSWLTGAGTSGDTELAAIDEDEPAATTTPPLDVEATTTTAAPTTTVPPTTTSGPTTSTTMAGPPRIEMAASSVDFGSDKASVRFEMRNRGGQPAEVSVSSTAPWITVGPARLRIDGGQTAAVTIAVDRSTAPEGEQSGQVRVAVASPGTGGGNVAITATISRPPVIDSVTAEPGRFFTRGCAPDSATVRTRVTDDSGVQSVVLQWTEPDGRAQSTPMADVGGGRYEAKLGPVDTAGNATFRVVATDTRGAQSASGTGTVVVEQCTTPTT